MKPEEIKKGVEQFVGQMVAFNTSLKLTHWHITGVGSYTKHIALDDALSDLLDITDRLVETSYALYGDLEISVSEAKYAKDAVKLCSDFYDVAEKARAYFSENFSQAIIDDYQEAIQQLLYKLKRLQ